MRAGATDWEDPRADAAIATPRDGAIPSAVDLARAAAFLRAEAPRIAAAAVIGTALAIGVWVVLPAKYTASALVMVDPRNAKVTSADEVLPGIGGDSAAIASIAEIATSEGALAPVVAVAKLAEDPEFAGASSKEADVVAALRKAVKVTRRGLTYVIEVSATSKDSEKAARLANAVAADIVARQSATRVNASTGAAGALESRLADLRAAAIASEKAVSEYRMSHGLLDVTADSTVGQRRLASLSQQASSLRARLEEAKARWDELKRAKPQDIGGASSPRSDLLVTLRNQLSEEKRQAAELTRIFGPRHPKVETSQERFAAIEEQIRAETTRLVDQARTEVETLTRQNAALEAELAKRTNAELAMNQDEVVLRDLIRQAEADRQIYEQFLSRQKSAQEQSSLTRPETAVVSKAVAPSRSNKPGLTLVAPVGFFAGLFAGVGLSLLRRRPDDVSSDLVADATEAPVRSEPKVPREAPVERRPSAAPPPAVAVERSRVAAESRPEEPRPILRPSPMAAVGAAARRLTARPDPQTIFAELGTPVVADLPRLTAPARLGSRGDRRFVGDVDLAVVDARPAMMPFAETFFPHLKTDPGQALMVTNVPGAVGRTTMALAVARMAEAVGLTALIVTDHGEAHDLRPSLADVLTGRHDLAALPPPETVDRVSVMGFGGDGDDGFWDLAEDGRLPALMARLTRHWDLVVVESSAPEDENRDVLPPTEAFRAVLLVADRDRNTMADVAENAALWAEDGERLVMVGLNRAA
ncbi:MAG: GumC family protein [Siculibacillus sp.]|nr:GumC family protein [Siculibacillus sp.]